MGLFDYSDVGIDLGTSTTLIYVRNKGIVLREPSVVAIDKANGSICAIGDDARRMPGQNPRQHRRIKAAARRSYIEF